MTIKWVYATCEPKQGNYGFFLFGRNKTEVPNKLDFGGSERGEPIKGHGALHTRAVVCFPRRISLVTQFAPNQKFLGREMPRVVVSISHLTK